MSSSGLSRKAAACWRRSVCAKSSLSALAFVVLVRRAPVFFDSGTTHRPFPNRNLLEGLDSPSLALASELSPVRYGFLPRAWRSRICGVNWWLLAAADDAAADWWPWVLPASDPNCVDLLNWVDCPGGGGPPEGADML